MPRTVHHLTEQQGIGNNSIDASQHQTHVVWLQARMLIVLMFQWYVAMSDSVLFLVSADEKYEQESGQIQHWKSRAEEECWTIPTSRPTWRNRQNYLVDSSGWSITSWSYQTNNADLLEGQCMNRCALCCFVMWLFNCMVLVSCTRHHRRYLFLFVITHDRCKHKLQEVVSLSGLSRGTPMQYNNNNNNNVTDQWLDYVRHNP